jgi:two-component system nitrogen regulation sensor histidine kinase GlnL
VSKPARRAAGAAQLQALDLLATMVAVVLPDGECVFANAQLESVVGVSRRLLTQRALGEWLREPAALREAIDAVARNEFSTRRFEGVLRRAAVGSAEPLPLPVHIIVSQTDRVGGQIMVEMIEIEQQTRQDREERVLGQAEVTKELIRNLAHEIKNPLGGIRGAAQLLALDLTSPELTEYTQVIIHEADRLQTLVDRLLAPHRKPHVVGDVNIHEVCERVRSLVLVEYARGLRVVRDYDASIPEFRGDREQLIQAMLNIVQNAAQALAERIDQGEAEIRLRTRIARQVTIGKQRYRLALELHIQDNGPGVPDHLRERIFYPLVSGREGGSGLGLTLAQTFVQQHQGTIECDSEPGRTVFKIVIPLP